MHLLIADKLALAPLSELELLGVKLHVEPQLKEDELPERLAELDPDILVVRSTKVTRQAIEAAPSLSLIVRAGAGVNTIDVETASKRGVYVSNCPGRNAAAVAELTMGLVLALDRRLVDATSELRAGRWDKSEFSQARGIFGRHMGVAGVGGIGKLVIERALGFGMRVHAWSRSLTPVRATKLGIEHARNILDLARMSDVFTVHLPLNAHTKRIVSRQVLEALPDGAIVVNTARAEVMDFEALADLAPKKGLRVGLDVFPSEPKTGKASFSSSLFESGIIYGTPHIGASTEQAQLAIAREVSRIVRAFLTEEDVPHVVNVCKNTPARFALVMRARDEVGVLANALNVLKRHGINIEEVSNTVFEGASAACTKLRLSGRPSERCLQEIRAFEEVFHVDVVALPNLA
ncbi:MAG TPA: NAD(P)-dependent oxidoreductase [Polyangiaceae bacterium]|nr:NAD(P)-dependent oxidoreductase [Polyangiaceae bacterium]